MHLTSEKLIKKVPLCLVEKNVVVGSLYHFIYGLIFAYSIREIIEFIRKIRKRSDE